MTITYPLSLPNVGGRQSIRIRQKVVVGATQSPFTLQRQVQEFPGARWEADITLPPMVRADAMQWVAFLVSLIGTKGTFLLGDTAGRTPRGNGGGTPLVKGASQTGATLTFDGVGTAVAGYLRAGDWLQLGSGSSSRLHMVLQDCNSVAGEVTADIWPKLRSSPADNAPITLVDTKGVFALPPGMAADWNINNAMHYGLAFSAQEVV